MNSLHEDGCFSMVSVFRGVPPIWGLFLASWPLAGLLLASSWPPARAGLLLASCWLLPGLLLASSWPLAGLLLASWLLAGFKFPQEDLSLKSVFQRARKTSEFSS